MRGRSRISIVELVMIGAVACAGSTSTLQAGTITSIAELLDLFTNNGFARPTITCNETETQIDLVIIGQYVDANTSDSFTTDFAFNFWRGNLTFTETDPWTESDLISVSGLIWHQAGIDRPHPGDALRGDTWTFGLVVDSGGAGSSGPYPTPAARNAGTVSHPNIPHTDEYEATLQANVNYHQYLSNDILSWTFRLKGKHVIPEPAVGLTSGVLVMMLVLGRRRMKV